jgi:c-di-GMP-binding flagellar brake protein YcgR
MEAFRIDDVNAVQTLLKTLLDRDIPLHISASDGSVYTTALWAVDCNQRKIGFLADMLAPAVHRLVEAEEAVAVGYLDRIKLQFEVADRLLVHGHHACVLQARMPSEIFRFQRRGAFRVRTLDRTTPIVSFRHPAMPEMRVELRVLDISMGGCALWMPNDVPMLEPGVEVRGAHVELDNDTSFDAMLVMQHVTAIQPNARGVRLGCELRHLSGAAQRLLQRYVDQTQKRRRLLAQT